MTDFQFRALMTMVLNIMNTNSIEDAKKIIENLAQGKTGNKVDENDD
jgi:hypothetical protein